jgi:NAD+ kinase
MIKKTIAIFTLPSKPEAKVYAVEAAKILNELGVDVIGNETFCNSINETDYPFISECGDAELERKADLLISFGGDGTMLSASKILIDSGVPVMGFNVGKLGFLAEYPTSLLRESLIDLINGDYRVVERSILETEIKGKTYYALNDCIMEKKNTSRMITISAFSNNHHVADYRADGLILTTPTGSTAYSLSCNGPIIVPGTPVFCLTPISPHTLTLRPLVIPNTSDVKMIVKSPTGESNFVIDGQDVLVVKDGEEVIIRKSNAVVKLVKPINSSYFDLLKEKLLWASQIPFDKHKSD